MSGASRRLSAMAAMVAVALALSAPARAQSIPGLVELPPTVTASTSDLVRRRAALEEERATLHGQIEALNARCASVVVGSAAQAACKTDQAALLSALGAHVQASNDFNAAAQAAIASAPAPDRPPPALDPAVLRVINGIEALARQRGWSATKLARLDANLRALDPGDPTATPAEIRATWRAIFVRGQDADLVREASRDGGLGFAGAGTQSHNDCAIFALASATGQTYGLVAASAAELISRGGWRDAADRANPQAAIETGGLNGGEVVMMAEIYGQSEVAPSTRFPSLLAQGRQVIVGVAPYSGDGDIGHEIVLAKAFQHAGETWYVIIDSNQGPTQRLFASARELNRLVWDNGVVYRPYSKRTPDLLRGSAAR